MPSRRCSAASSIFCISRAISGLKYSDRVGRSRSAPRVAVVEGHDGGPVCIHLSAEQAIADKTEGVATMATCRLCSAMFSAGCCASGPVVDEAHTGEVGKKWL